MLTFREVEMSQELMLSAESAAKLGLGISSISQSTPLKTTRGNITPLPDE
jgi:hypothetical protein